MPNRQLLRQYSSEDEAHYNLGVLPRLGQVREDAEASYSQALALKPDYAEALQLGYNAQRPAGEIRGFCRQLHSSDNI